MMILRFASLTDVRTKTFLGIGNHREHMLTWMEKWSEHTTEEWVHLFIHALGPISITWYLDAELHQHTRHWETLKDDFIGNFGLIRGMEELDEAMQDIDFFVFNDSCYHAAPEFLTWEA